MNDKIPSFNLSQDELNYIRYKAFLKELTALSQKYDIYIKGCGCCGSPYLIDGRTKEKYYDDLTYDKDTGYYVRDLETEEEDI